MALAIAGLGLAWKHVTPCEKYPGAYEFRAASHHARVMFFYTICDGSPVAVCTHAFWKDWNSRQAEKEQDEAFEKCAKTKQIFEKHIQTLKLT